MNDTTVSTLVRASDFVPNSRRRISGRARFANEDELLARVLITSRSLATGRRLRNEVPPQALTEDELIAFWADDLIGTAASGQPGGQLRAVPLAPVR